MRTLRQTRRRMHRRTLGPDERGAVIIEFALVAMPFLFILFGTIELALIFVANASLENAALQLARQVRVGSIVLPGAAVSNGTGNQMTLSSFKTSICAGVTLLSQATCLGQLQVDVRTQSAFTGQTAPTPVNAGNFSTSGFCFYSGAPGNIVTMHVYLLWPVTTPVLLNALAQVTSMTTGAGTTTGNFFVLNANEVFKNEPNATSSNTGNGC